MNWKTIINHIPHLTSGGDADPVITGVTYDSRHAGPGTLFVAIEGFKSDGDAYIADAIARGSVAVISRKPQVGSTVPWITVEDPRAAIGSAAKALWGKGIDSTVFTGITGTNGKTTTATLYRHLYAMRSSKQESWLFGTIAYEYDGQVIDAPHTTPESSDIYGLIGKAKQPPRAVSMEVSSHALQLNRITGLSFNVAVWTNLTQDHLDFHKTMDAYYSAKKRLFTEYLRPDGVAIVNSDDPWGERLADEIRATCTVVTYGESVNADLRITGWKCDWKGSSITVGWRKQELRFTSRLTGGFNRYNIAALIAGGVQTGFDGATIQRALDAAGAVRGRMEPVLIDAPFAVIVDYAHTPDALEKALATARELTAGRLITVFGCGGDRDRLKRPLMAKAVVAGSDEAIVTSDNPRSEKPQAIIAEIVTGIPLDFPHHTIADRREAIRCALRSARPQDCVMIAGKGHEDYQEINGVRHHFDDCETVRSVYAELKGECE